jgi:hypothetical protein
MKGNRGKGMEGKRERKNGIHSFYCEIQGKY